jgi:SEC-C motif domain protein
MMEDCYCCSGKNFADCCLPFIEGTTRPITAEQLMRSRYTAYVVVNVEYILKTTHPSTRKTYDLKAVSDWAKSSIWQKLEVISTEKGTLNDKHGIVEFKAYYLDSNSNPQIHHETSTFTKELGKWFFVDGSFLA